VQFSILFVRPIIQVLDILLFHRGKSYGLFNCAWIQNHINMPLDKIILRVVQLLCQRKVAMHGGI